MRFLKNLVRGKKGLPSEVQVKEIYNHNLHKELTVNLNVINNLYSATPDLVIQQFHIKHTNKSAALVYLDGLTDKFTINESILQPLMHEDKGSHEDWGVTIGLTKTVNTWQEIEGGILTGYAALFIDGRQQALLCDSQGWPQRPIQEPQAESAIKGAHQGFVETAKYNIALIRRYIPHRELKIKEYLVGTRGQTKVSILYLADVVDPAVLKEMEDRIKNIKIDAILTTGALGELTEDNPFSIFPQLLVTERPDAAASHILQGRLAVVVDVSPGVLIGPMTFTSFFQAADDYSNHWISASFLRLIRFLALLIAIFLPSLYIATTSFHYEIIPLALLLTVGESRAMVPFPPILEALMMEIFLEMLREAGLRLPSPVGQAVGIVGGIVIGQAAVQVGIVSNIMVIVVSITAIASFIIPNYDMSIAIRLLRFPLMIMSALFGMVGIVIGLMILIAHLISLKSLKVPYGTPLAPIRFSDFRDTFFRLPLWMLDKRPYAAKPKQIRKFVWNKTSGDNQ